MEYGDLVALYQKKLLSRYEQCCGGDRMGKTEQINRIEECLKQLTEKEQEELLAWMQDHFPSGSR